MIQKIPTSIDALVGRQYKARREILLFFILTSFLALLLLSLLSSVSADTKFLNQYFVWLYAANIIVGAILLLVIVVLIITLAIRWRQGYFGTKLIVKLAMIFGLVGVLPGAILYSVSLQFVSKSIESWFDVNVESALDAGLQLGQRALEKEQNEFVEIGSKLPLGLLAQTKVATTLKSYCDTTGANQIAILNATGDVKLKYQCLENVLVESIHLFELLPMAEKSGKSSMVDELLNPNNSINYEIISLYKLPGKQFLRLTKELSPGLGENSFKVQQAYSDYQEKSLSRVGLRKMYIGSLTLTMFLALFIALVLALILGRQLAQPLLMLLRGTQAVAQGDLSPKPETDSQDELGMLTRQFNNMTRQIADARQSLQEAKDFSESVLTNLTAGVCVLDSQYCLLVVNPSAKRILERDMMPLIGKPLGAIPELVHFESMIKEAFKANQVSIDGEENMSALSSRSKVLTENSWQRQIQLYPGLDQEDDSTPVLLVRGTELLTRQFIIVFDDITEVIAAQRSVAWGEVARRMAHEIKNPLTPIQLSAERIFQKLTGKMPEDQEEIIAKGTNTIIKQVQAMKKMVNDFRDFAKTPTLNLQSLDLNQLIQEILGLYEGVDIKLNLDPLCPSIWGDQTQLRQVIHNILQNAQDAALEKSHEPKIEIRTEVAEYESHDISHEKLVRMTVTDNGPGFSPRILSRAFEPYVTSKSKGTGLGLAVVKILVDEHEARIELKNRIRDGHIVGARISILFQKLAPIK